eukprot:363838-Chlamydomonas_euryale.AAC.3
MSCTALSRSVMVVAICHDLSHTRRCISTFRLTFSLFVTLCHILSWLVSVCHGGLSRFVMMTNDQSYLSCFATEVCHGLPWFVMICRALSWRVMVCQRNVSASLHN